MLRHHCREVTLSRRAILSVWTLPLALYLSAPRVKAAQLSGSSFIKNIAANPRLYREASGRTAPTMSYSFGQTITQQSRGSHSATVIFLHGLGDTGNGWASVGRELSVPHVKFVFPTAPTRPVSLNGGMPMPAWFDLAQLDQLLKGEQDGPGVAASIAHIDGLIQKEINAGIPADRIIVGGFSQGGHVALKMLLGTKQRLAGCIALSTWLEFAANSSTQQRLEPSNAALSIPVFIGHGTVDPLIPSSMANNSEQTLQKLGYKSVKRRMYQGMPHSSCPEELDDIRDFILQMLPDKPPPPKSSAEIEAMSVKELKQYLQARGISTTGMLEKSEYVSAAKAAL